MEGLKTYFSSIDPHLFSHVSGKPREFIDVFRAHDFLSEEAFIRKLCGGKDDNNSYREWKSRTVKILQALVIISHARGSSLVKKKYDNCQKKFLLGQKFLTQGQRKEGIRLIKQAYLIAEGFDFSHLACELGSILHHDHVYYHRNKKLAALYAQKVKKYLANYMAEKEAEYYFYNVVEQMYSSIETKQLKEAMEGIIKVRGDSIKYKVYEASIKVLYGIHTGKCEQIINSCTEAIQFFNDKAGAYPAYYIFFLKNKGIAQTATEKYIEARTSFEQAEKYTNNSLYNAHMIQFYKILNELHAGNYQIAYKLYQKNKRCKIEEIRQQFVIIEAYLGFLAHAGFLQLDKIFRIGKYLNDTFKAQKEKQGDNINIIIAELLIYLARDKGKFIDRIEAVKHYSYHHLKGEDTKRAKNFLKILCLMAHPKVNFHPVALQRKAGRYIDLLNTQPVRVGENFTVEIIPYNVLLDMIVNKLMKKVA